MVDFNDVFENEAPAMKAALGSVEVVYRSEERFPGKSATFQAVREAVTTENSSVSDVNFDLADEVLYCQTSDIVLDSAVQVSERGDTVTIGTEKFTVIEFIVRGPNLELVINKYDIKDAV